MSIFRYCSHVILLSILLSTAEAGEELAEKVCKQTSNYSFCKDALYSDPRVPDADEILLAYISFGLAYTNASGTQKLIPDLIKNASSPAAAKPLRHCAGYYDKAVKKIAAALNDLDSETYYFLGWYAGNASRSAVDCEAAFVGPTRSPMTALNGYLVGLCEICTAVAKMFHVS